MWVIINTNRILKKSHILFFNVLPVCSCTLDHLLLTICSWPFAILVISWSSYNFFCENSSLWLSVLVINKLMLRWTSHKQKILSRLLSRDSYAHYFDDVYYTRCKFSYVHMYVQSCLALLIVWYEQTSKIPPHEETRLFGKFEDNWPQPNILSV